MKKLFVLIAISVSILSFTNNARVNIAASTKDSVYICLGKRAYAYHSTLNCYELKHCKSEIIKVSLYDAVNKYYRRACKICE